jgi:ABC-type multidrug transport system ATPase subunit
VRATVGPVLVADSVGKRYGDRRVLTSATLRADASAVTALLGRNGAGKSTLLRIAAGWLAPDTGTVRYKGTVHLRPRLHQLARAGLFYLPDRELLSHSFTVRQHLEMVARCTAAGGAPGDIAAAAELTGIAGRLDRRPPSLSGGELRRAELAVALVRAPDCLLADEPYRGIAPTDAEVLTAVFRRLARAGCAVVVSGHEVPTLLDVATSVVWCTGGTTHQLGPPAAAREDWHFRQGYLGWAGGA